MFASAAPFPSETFSPGRHVELTWAPQPLTNRTWTAHQDPSMGVPSSLGALLRSWGQGHQIDSTPTGLGSREARLENWGGKRAISTLRWWWHKSWWVSGSPWCGDLMCRLAWGWTQAHRPVALCYSSMEEGWWGDSGGSSKDLNLDSWSSMLGWPWLVLKVYCDSIYPSI